MSERLALTRDTLSDFPLPPMRDGDKYDHGRLLVVAGSRSLPGAALLCARASMRAGAGKMQIATVESVAIPIGVAMPEARSVGVPEGSDGGFAEAAIPEIVELACAADAVVAGPGLLEGPTCAKLAEALLDTGVGLALDAGILRALRPFADKTRASKAPPVLLPHAGEMAALLDCEEERVEADPIACGKECARHYGAVTLVKGPTSHVIDTDGTVFIFESDAPGLGVSGSGDTLAGIVGGLLARGGSPLTALLWGVLLHGEAGQELTRRVGLTGFLAGEIVDVIPSLLPQD